MEVLPESTAFPRSEIDHSEKTEESYIYVQKLYTRILSRQVTKLLFPKIFYSDHTFETSWWINTVDVMSLCPKCIFLYPEIFSFFQPGCIVADSIHPIYHYAGEHRTQACLPVLIS